MGSGTVSRKYSTSRKVRWIRNSCFCLLTTVTLGIEAASLAFAAADDPILESLEGMGLQIKDLRNQLKKAEEENQRLVTSIARLKIDFVHYRVDGGGNLTTGAGAELGGMDPAKPLVIKKSENLFCAISKTASNVRGDNGRYIYLCDVARNTENLWTVTAANMSSCRVACVGMELVRKEDERLPASR